MHEGTAAGAHDGALAGAGSAQARVAVEDGHEMVKGRACGLERGGWGPIPQQAVRFSKKNIIMYQWVTAHIYLLFLL